MKRNSERLYLLSNEKVSKALLKLGVPTMIGMMTSALYNLVDAYFVGQLGTSQIGAVSVVFPIGVILLGVGLLFGSGASSYLARLLGNKQFKEADECASTAVGASMVTAILIILAMLQFLNPFLKVLGATDSIMPYAKEYAVWFLIGLIFNVFNITVNNIITAEGATSYSMIAMLTGGVVNVILDPIFIFKLDLGVKGAAFATLLSRFIVFCIYMYYILRGRSNFHFSIKNFRLQRKVFAEIFKIGIPMLVYQLLCSLALSLTNSQAAKYGDEAVAAIGVVNRILSLGAMMIMGFLKGYQPFVGYNYAAGNQARVKEATKTALLWTTIFCISVAVLFIGLKRPLIQAFIRTDSNVLRIGQKTLVMNLLTFIGMGYQMVYSTMFMGLGKAKEGGMISIGRQGMFFIPILLIAAKISGLNGIIAAQPLADICSMILVFYLVHRKASGKLLQVDR
ncbi:MAG: MATE family efflux transporter [Velocimicrobium sp.]